MKKRILALALAGTTAFSVFGAAISANAAWPSTDTRYDVDAYVSYAPVAEKISAESATAASTKTVYYYKDNGQLKKVGTNGTEAELNVYLSNLAEIRENYTKVTAVVKATDGTTFYVTDDCTQIIGYTETNAGALTALDDAALKRYLNITKSENGVYYIGNNFETPYVNLADAIKVVRAANYTGDNVAPDMYVFKPVQSAHRYHSTKDFEAAVKYETKAAYANPAAGNIVVTTEPVNGSGTNVVKVNDDTNVDGWKSWTFNSDMTGEATVEPYAVNTELVGGKLVVTKKAVPTVYAYDFLPLNDTSADAGTIAYNWNRDDLANTAAGLVPYKYAGGNVDLVAETGRGRAGMGVRYDVVSNWVDFLDELAINGDSKGYVESEAEFVSNYADMFYSEPYYDIWTGQQIGSVSVDLYNIKGLLHDIYSLNNASEYYAANTSEMVYLMQQYDKYIGEYIDKTEVGSSEWGELMLTVLNAASQDDFKKASDYKKYMNKVDDLEDAYEEATTVGMIKEAEEGMYDLLTSAPYTAASVDKTNLNATLGGLFFNAKYAPGTYATAPSTAGNAAYTNYNYLVAVAETTGNDYNFTTKMVNGFYSLYPMADYIDNDTATPNSNYNGNVASKDFNGKYATEEYEWFWNVYQLAVNMSGTNKYQGAVDAINEALNDAVSNLTVTTTPYATETSAMEEMVEEYAGKIDTDYNEGYYAKYTQANDYAENVAEGKWQTRIARNIVGVAGEALTFQGTQVTVTKNDMKTVETAIKNGEAALKAIKEDANYNAAQVNALNKAIAEAQTIVDIYEGSYSTSAANQSVNHVYTRLVGDKDQIVKSDLTKAIEAIDAAINYSEIVMGWSKNEAGKWMYGTEEGYLTNGWNKIGKTWFYFNADGTAKQSEWFQENGTWYWFNSNCGAACGWAKVDGEWYYFKGNNAMKTGWEKVDGNWYYMASSGKMVTGWCEIGGKWYYFSKESNSLGQMLYSTTVDGYKLDANGVWVK